MEEQSTSSYHVSYNLTPEDAEHVYRQIMWVHRQVSPAIHNVFHLLITAVPLFAMVKLISFLAREAGLLPCFFFGLAGISGMGLLLLKLREANLLKYLRFVRETPPPSRLHGPREMWFSAEGIRMDTSLGRMDLPWSQYTYLFETADTFFLIQLTGDRKESYLFLPKISLGGLEQQEAFVSFCLERGLKAQQVSTYGTEDSIKKPLRTKMIVLFFAAVFLLTASVSMLYFDMIYSYLFSV